MKQLLSELAIRIRDGDTAALEEIMSRYTPYLFTIVSNMAKEQLTEQDIEETVSDVFLRFWKNRALLKPDLSLKSYLIRITRNLTIDKLRKQKNIELPLIEELEYAEDYIEAEVDAKELYASLQTYIDSQTSQDKEILLRYYTSFQKTKDIAKEMQLTEGAVRTRLCRLRAKLKCFLEKEDCHYAE